MKEVKENDLIKKCLIEGTNKTVSEILSEFDSKDKEILKQNILEIYFLLKQCQKKKQDG